MATVGHRGPGPPAPPHGGLLPALTPLALVLVCVSSHLFNCGVYHPEGAAPVCCDQGVASLCVTPPGPHFLIVCFNLHTVLLGFVTYSSLGFWQLSPEPPVHTGSLNVGERVSRECTNDRQRFSSQSQGSSHISL